MLEALTATPNPDLRKTKQHSSSSTQCSLSPREEEDVRPRPRGSLRPSRRTTASKRARLSARARARASSLCCLRLLSSSFLLFCSGLERQTCFERLDHIGPKKLLLQSSSNGRRERICSQFFASPKHHHQCSTMLTLFTSHSQWWHVPP